MAQNRVIAYMLFNLASVEGDNAAILARELAMKSMTNDQIAEGQALSRNWKLGDAIPTSTKH